MKLVAIALSAVLVVGSGWSVSPVGADEGSPVPPVAETTPLEITSPGYANLVELTGNICTGAAEVFRDFFDFSPIQVHPFVHVSSLANDSSLLGVALADQMTAMLNDQSNAVATTTDPGGGQRLEGVLLEVDGYLRIHMAGTNKAGARRSHVALVEMSAPLYRALHTYADAGTW